jgi:hypothetical protein
MIRSSCNERWGKGAAKVGQLTAPKVRFCHTCTTCRTPYRGGKVVVGQTGPGNFD